MIPVQRKSDANGGGGGIQRLLRAFHRQSETKPVLPPKPVPIPIPIPETQHLLPNATKPQQPLSTQQRRRYYELVSLLLIITIIIIAGIVILVLWITKIGFFATNSSSSHVSSSSGSLAAVISHTSSPGAPSSTHPIVSSSAPPSPMGSSSAPSSSIRGVSSIGPSSSPFSVTSTPIPTPCDQWTVNDCFFPNQIPAPTLWLSSDTYNTGQSPPWLDQSGNGYNAELGNAPAAEYDYLNGIEAVVWAEYYADAYLVLTGAFPYSQNMAFSFVLTVQGQSSDEGLYTILGSTTVGAQNIGIYNPSLVLEYGQGGASTKSIIRNAPTIVSGIFTYSTLTIQYYIGGYAAGSTSGGAFTGPDVTLGAITMSYYFVGDMYEIVLWNANENLTLVELQAFEAKAAGRYGLNYPQTEYCC